MTQWDVLIVEGVIGNQKADGLSCEELQAALTRLTTDGWIVRFITPNGVNRWTVISAKESA